MFGSCSLTVLALAGSAGQDTCLYSSSEVLERIRSPLGYEASVVCSGITGADGLAISAEGILYAVSETEGIVYRIEPPGYPVAAVEGLDHPEGIAIDSLGIIYVCEDVAAGRVIAIRPDGAWTVLRDSLQYPEGVSLAASGDVYLTESSAEGVSIPPFLTGVRRISSTGPDLQCSSLYLWSLSDLTVDAQGYIYACNELSGYAFIRESVVRTDLSSGRFEIFTRDLRSCEGICPTPGSFFPLYVAEEDTGGGCGRISAVDDQGGTSTVAEGFRNVEDVIVDGGGRIFVSEDTTGMIIMLRPPDGS
jgi:hypothetical protein